MLNYIADKNSIKIQWRIQNFPDWGYANPMGGRQLFFVKNCIKQECITVGCVPPAR